MSDAERFEAIDQAEKTLVAECEAEPGYRWAAPRARELPSLLAVDYLPLDTRGNVRRLLRTIRPDALVYAKYDLWPNLVWGAARAGATPEEVAETIGVNIQMGGGPATIYGPRAWQAYKEFADR